MTADADKLEFQQAVRDCMTLEAELLEALRDLQAVDAFQPWLSATDDGSIEWRAHALLHSERRRRLDMAEGRFRSAVDARDALMPF